MTKLCSKMTEKIIELKKILDLFNKSVKLKSAHDTMESRQVLVRISKEFWQMSCKLISSTDLEISHENFRQRHKVEKIFYRDGKIVVICNHGSELSIVSEDGSCEKKTLYPQSMGKFIMLPGGKYLTQTDIRDNIFAILDSDFQEVETIDNRERYEQLLMTDAGLIIGRSIWQLNLVKLPDQDMKKAISKPLFEEIEMKDAVFGRYLDFLVAGNKLIVQCGDGHIRGFRGDNFDDMFLDKDIGYGVNFSISNIDDIYLLIKTNQKENIGSVLSLETGEIKDLAIKNNNTRPPIADVSRRNHLAVANGNCIEIYNFSKKSGGAKLIGTMEGSNKNITNLTYINDHEFVSIDENGIMNRWSEEE